MRASLSNQGGAIATHGEPNAATWLARALQAAEGRADDLTHGFHSYPARMHPGIAASIIDVLSERGARVLDPFCGSGTVLVEAMLAGRRSIGIDLSPLALRIAEAHVARPNAEQRARFLQALDAVSAASLARVRARVPARAPLDAQQRAFYDPHVLIELAGLLAEIRARPEHRTRRMLEVVFSSLLVKLSNQRGDTSDELTQKRIRKGLSTELFVRKGQELAERWAALEAAAPPDVIAPELRMGDARALANLVRGELDLILTSPPYGGTYDYVAHHARRYAWLDLDASALTELEVGARRTISQARDGRARWDAELLACLKAMRAVLAPTGCIVLLIGDGEALGERIDAHAQLARLAPRAELELVSSAAQAREDFNGGAARREHLILLAPK
jgi:methylase of polypeptide subunit release factors